MWARPPGHAVDGAKKSEDRPYGGLRFFLATAVFQFRGEILARERTCALTRGAGDGFIAACVKLRNRSARARTVPTNLAPECVRHENRHPYSGSATAGTAESDNCHRFWSGSRRTESTDQRTDCRRFPIRSQPEPKLRTPMLQRQ